MPAKPHLSTRPYRHGDLPRALADAAIAALERTGTPDFTLRSLARDVGVSHAAPYAHFEDKEALLDEVRRLGYKRLVAAMSEAVTGTTGTERLRACGCAYVEFGRMNPGLYRLMFAGADDVPPALDAIRIESASILVRAVDAALGPDATPRERDDAGLAAWSIVHGLTLLILDGRVDVDSDRVGRVIAATLHC
jgi:AcrR family transcriptional regulator